MATETNPDVAGMLTAALTAAPAPQAVLEQIAGALPYRTVALAGAAAEVFRQLAAQAAPGGSERAGRIVSLSNRLSDLGRREEALTAIDEAVTIRRTLASIRPAVFASRYANSLEIQAAILSALGRDGEAKAIRDEAAAISRSERIT